MAPPSDVRLHTVRTEADLPGWADRACVARFFHEHMKPWHDTLEDVGRGLDYAFSDAEGKGGFLLLAEREDEMVGGLLLLHTGMGGYVPAHLLLFVSVHPDLRGQGIGGRLVERARTLCDGPIKLHVEYDNPAKRLYERLGFESKYAEMRYTP